MTPVTLQELDQNPSTKPADSWFYGERSFKGETLCLALDGVFAGQSPAVRVGWRALLDLPSDTTWKSREYRRKETALKALNRRLKALEETGA